MISVVIIGSGNVVFHLLSAFSKTKDVAINQVIVRGNGTLDLPCDVADKVSNNFDNLPPSDVYIIAVSDDAILEVSNKIIDKKALVVHTSGGVSKRVLKSHKRRGVFYPLQSFSKQRKLDFSRVPFCLEAETEEDLTLLENLTTSIKAKSYKINSSQRQRLHTAAVFVNNFVNHLYAIGKDICDKNDIPFEILYPLIDETSSKIKQISPEKAQTGPAIRDDKKTIQNHLKLIDVRQKEVYTSLTKSIQKMEKSYKEFLTQIDTLIFDVDGVLTNGIITVMPDGELVRQVNVKDGYALKHALDMGLRVAIISGGNNQGVKKRFQNLGIRDIYLGIRDKTVPFDELKKKYQLELQNVLYMGDDLPDYQVMELVGLPCCPRDASPEIQNISKYISHKNGGEGCVRDIIEQILRVQGKWNEDFTNN